MALRFRTLPRFLSRRKRLKITVSLNGAQISRKVLGHDRESLVLPLAVFMLWKDEKEAQPDDRNRVVNGEYLIKALRPGNTSQDRAPGVQVALVQPAEYGCPDLNIVTTGADGTYKVAGVPPGKYKLLAVEDDALSAIPRGRGMEDYEDIAESLELHSGDKIAKDLKQRK